MQKTEAKNREATENQINSQIQIAKTHKERVKALESLIAAQDCTSVALPDDVVEWLRAANKS